MTMTTTMTTEARKALVEKNLPLVRSLAAKLASRAAPHLEFGDLVAVGTEALLRAADRYDASRGVAFGSFAYLRARGAMIESIGAIGPHTRGRARRRGGRDRDDLPTFCPYDDSRGAVPRDSVLRADHNGEMALAIDAARLTPCLEPALAGLGRRERDLILRHYFAGHTLLEIGRDLGRSKSWASRIHGHALDRLRAGIEQLVATRRAPAVAAGSAA
jgi:RNA polymerase sigma factor for flagellar operon FliA